MENGNMRISTFREQEIQNKIADTNPEVPFYFRNVERSLSARPFCFPGGRSFVMIFYARWPTQTIEGRMMMCKRPHARMAVLRSGSGDRMMRLHFDPSLPHILLCSAIKRPTRHVPHFSTFPPQVITTMANDPAASRRSSTCSSTSSSSTNAANSTRSSVDGERQQQRHRRHRRVAFNETTRILIVPGLWQFPEKVKRDIFYDNDDYLDMKDDIRRSARAARKGRAGADDCIRGIEHLRSRSHIEERRSSQRAVFDAVLTTQDRLREDGRADAVEIARASMCRTRKAKDRARDFAMQDEEDADQIYAASKKEAQRTAIFATLNAELGDNLAKLDITCRRNI